MGTDNGRQNECSVCGGKHNLRKFTWSTGEEVLLCERCADTRERFLLDVKQSFWHGPLKDAVKKIEEEASRLMDKYFYQREANFNPDTGDFKAVRGGSYCQYRMDKFARLLLENVSVDGIDMLSLVCLGRPVDRFQMIRHIGWGHWMNKWKEIKDARNGVQSADLRGLQQMEAGRRSQMSWAPDDALALEDDGPPLPEEPPASPKNDVFRPVRNGWAASDPTNTGTVSRQTHGAPHPGYAPPAQGYTPPAQNYAPPVQKSPPPASRSVSMLGSLPPPEWVEAGVQAPERDAMDDLLQFSGYNNIDII